MAIPSYVFSSPVGIMMWATVDPGPLNPHERVYICWDNEFECCHCYLETIGL